MTGWEFKELSPVLEKAQQGDKTDLDKVLVNTNYAKTNADLTKLLVLRKFNAKPFPGMPDPLVTIGPPTADHFQWGITIVTIPEDGETEFSIYLPNKYNYTGIEFHKDEITILAEGMIKKTNIRELHLQMRDFVAIFKQNELEMAFDSLTNHKYGVKKSVQKKIKNPIILEEIVGNPILGTLTLDKQFERYDNNGTSKHFSFSIQIDCEEPSEVKKLLKFAEKSMEKKFYEKHLLSMEKEMIKIKNTSWLGENEEPMTAEEFRKRISIDSILFWQDKSVSIYCNDGDIFGEHTIDISIDEEGKYKGANLAG